MRKLRILWIFIAALGVILTGCSKKKETKGGAEKVTTEKVTLRMWVMPNSSKPQEDMEKLIKPFLKANPNIDVKMEVLDWGSAWTKISTAATSGDAPDLVQIGSTWISQFSSMGAFLNIDDLANSLGGGKAFVKGTWEYSKPIFSGKVTSLPWIVDVRPLFYRKDVFAKAGIKVGDIDTWDGFNSALEKISKAKIMIDGKIVAPIGFPGKNDWNVVHNLAPWIKSAGGGFLSADGKKSLLGTKESLKGVMQYINMVKNGLMPKDYLEKNTAQLSGEFDQGSIATWFEPTSKYVYLTKSPEQGGSSNTIGAKNFGVTLPPKGPAGRNLFLGGSNIAIYKVSKHPAEAKKLLTFLTTNVEAQIEYFKISGMLPGYRAAFNDPYFESDNIRKVFKEMTKYGKPYPSVPFWAEIETSVLTVKLGELFEYIKLTKNSDIKKSDVSKILQDASAQIDNIIFDYFKKHPELAKK